MPRHLILFGYHCSLREGADLCRFLGQLTLGWVQPTGDVGKKLEGRRNWKSRDFPLPLQAGSSV